MANRERGEVSFEALGKTWVLRYGANALVEMEEVVGKPVGEVVKTLQVGDNVSVRLMRSVFWAGLTERQNGVTQVEAGDLMSEIGFDIAGQKIGEALTLAFPSPKEGEGGDRPQTGKDAGTGKSS